MITIHDNNFLYKNIIRPLFFKIDPEKAHHLVSWGAKAVQRVPPLLKLISVFNAPSSAITLWNMPFKNRLGLAAGFDKKGELIPFLSALGFGHLEIGTITYHPFAGNSRPRILRLPEEEAIINRMGLNNPGAAATQVLLSKLGLSGRDGLNKVKTKDKTKDRSKDNIPTRIGISIAKTPIPEIKGELAITDIVNTFKLLVPYADYIALNVSCPNVAEPFELYDSAFLSQLLQELQKEKSVPILLKLSPDLPFSKLKDITNTTLKNGISGFIISNTTSQTSAIGKGGLSGVPLREKSNLLLKEVKKLTGGEIPIIGVGGIDSKESAKEKINLGASLIQIYTGFIYEGPKLIREITSYL